MKLTAAELDAARKGYTRAFTDYVDDAGQVILPKAQREKLEEWCRPFLDAGIEIGGCTIFDIEGMQTEIHIRNVYRNGGKTQFLRTSVVPDHEYLISEVRKDYPGLEGFMSNRAGWWHLHPGYFGEPMLSVGDVEETRNDQKDWPDLWVFHLLVYGNPSNGQFDIGAFIVRHDAVYRLKVVGE